MVYAVIQLTGEQSNRAPYISTAGGAYTGAVTLYSGSWEACEAFLRARKGA